MKKRLKDVWKPMLIVAFFIYSGQFPSKWETDFILYGSSLPDTADMFSCGNVFARPLSEVENSVHVRLSEDLRCEKIFRAV